MTDWRAPENRREAFQRSYTFHLKYRTHPGLVYQFLPAIAEARGLDADGRAWLAWLNANTQNPATSLLLLDAAPHWTDWRSAVDFWNTHFAELEWDTDRRHQKSKFGEATSRWFEGLVDDLATPAEAWARASADGWPRAWRYALGLPYLGRLSAWSGLEFARILLGPDVVPDAGEWLLEDKSGSQSHRNGLALVAGYDSVYWPADAAATLGIVEELTEFADELLAEAQERNPGHPDVGRLTMESALCTYKSWHKPNRRYPNVYADMAYNRIRKAEARFGDRFQVLWEARAQWLPEALRLESNPLDPGMVPAKQNHYLTTGQPIMLDLDWPDMDNDFAAAVRRGDYKRSDT